MMTEANPVHRMHFSPEGWNAGAWDLPTRRPDGTWVPGEWRGLGRWPNSAPWDADIIELSAAIGQNWYARLQPGYRIWLAENDRPDVANAYGIRDMTKARLVREVEGWSNKAVLTFAADCVDHILPLVEKRVRNDTRVRDSVAVLRRLINGKATSDDVYAAGRAAHKAGENAGLVVPTCVFHLSNAASWAPGLASVDSLDWSLDCARHTMKCIRVGVFSAQRSNEAGRLAEAAEAQWQEHRLAQLVGITP
jgi:hypothetical protein